MEMLSQIVRMDAQKRTKHGILYPNYSNTHVRTQTHTHTHSKDLIYSRWSHFLLTAAPLGTQKSLYPI